MICPVCGTILTDIADISGIADIRCPGDHFRRKHDMGGYNEIIYATDLRGYSSSIMRVSYLDDDTDQKKNAAQELGNAFALYLKFLIEQDNLR